MLFGAPDQEQGRGRGAPGGGAPRRPDAALQHVPERVPAGVAAGEPLGGVDGAGGEHAP